MWTELADTAYRRRRRWQIPGGILIVLGGTTLIGAAFRVGRTPMGPAAPDLALTVRTWSSIAVLALSMAVVIAGVAWTIEGDAHHRPRHVLTEIVSGILQWGLFLIVLAQWALSGFPPGPRAWLTQRRGMLKLAAAYATGLVAAIVLLLVVVEGDLGSATASQLGWNYRWFERTVDALTGWGSGQPVHETSAFLVATGTVITLLGVIVSNRWARGRS